MQGSIRMCAAVVLTTVCLFPIVTSAKQVKLDVSMSNPTMLANQKQTAYLKVGLTGFKSEGIDKVIGLELGADDFIVKPFGVKEVVARIRAITRRSRSESNGTKQKQPFRMGDLEIYGAELRAKRGEHVIELSLRDVQLLELLHSRTGQVLDRNTIFNECWGEDYFPNSRSLDQHVSQLRKRIEVDPKSPQIIRTVHGAGYRYED